MRHEIMSPHTRVLTALLNRFNHERTQLEEERRKLDITISVIEENLEIPVTEKNSSREIDELKYHVECSKTP